MGTDPVRTVKLQESPQVLSSESQSFDHFLKLQTLQKKKDLILRIKPGMAAGEYGRLDY